MACLPSCDRYAILGVTLFHYLWEVVLSQQIAAVYFWAYYFEFVSDFERRISNFN
jgi:hypothetical protein